MDTQNEESTSEHAEINTTLNTTPLEDTIKNNSAQDNNFMSTVKQAVLQAVLPMSIVYALILPIMFLGGLYLGYFLWGKNAASAQATDPQVIVREIVVTPTGTTGENQSSLDNNGDGQAAQENNVVAADTASPTTQAEGTPSDTTKQTVTRYPVTTDDDPFIGPADAKITIIEFSDYQCPFCTRWHQEVFTKILQDYPNDVRIVYRDFPLESIHPQAIPAAEAANCALEQGNFWEYHTLLFDGGLSLGEANYMEYAKQLNLDSVQFEQCIKDRKYQEEVQADFDFAANLGVRSTPTFFINGIALVGAQPYDVFQQVIEGELNGDFE